MSSKVAIPPCTPTPRYQFQSPSDVLTLDVIHLFNFNGCNRCEVVSLCGSNLHSTNDSWCGAPSSCACLSLYISSGKMSKSFAYFLLACWRAHYVFWMQVRFQIYMWKVFSRVFVFLATAFWGTEARCSDLGQCVQLFFRDEYLPG